MKRRPRHRSAARMSAPEHELEHRLLAEAIGNDFQPPPFFDEQPFEEVRPCETTMRDRQAQVRDAGLEIVLETGERTGQDVGVIGAEAGRQLSGDRARGRLIAGGDPRLEFGPRIGRDLGCEVAHPMRQTALARRAGEAFLDRPDDPRRPVADHEQRIARSPLARRSWKNARTVSTSSFDPAINPKSDLRLSSPIPQAARTASRRWPGRSRFRRNAVDKQVGHRVFGEIALAEVFALGPQLLGDLAHRRPRQKPLAGLVGESVLDVARRQAPRVEFDRQSLEFPRVPKAPPARSTQRAQACPGLAEPNNPRHPSAVFILPGR